MQFWSKKLRQWGYVVLFRRHEMENRTRSCNLIIFWETPCNILEMNGFEGKRPVWLFLWQIEANYFTIRHSREIVDGQGSKFEDCSARFLCLFFFVKRKKLRPSPIMTILAKRKSRILMGLWQTKSQAGNKMQSFAIPLSLNFWKWQRSSDIYLQRWLTMWICNKVIWIHLH